MPRLGQIFLRLGAKKNKADEFYRRAFELLKSGLRHRGVHFSGLDLVARFSRIWQQHVAIFLPT